MADYIDFDKLDEVPLEQLLALITDLGITIESVQEVSPRKQLTAQNLALVLWSPQLTPYIKYPVTAKMPLKVKLDLLDELIQLTNLSYQPPKEDISSNLWPQLIPHWNNLNPAQQQKKSDRILSDLVKAPIRVSVNIYKKLWSYPMTILAQTSRLYLDIDTTRYYSRADFIFSYSTGYYQTVKGDDKRYQRLSNFSEAIIKELVRVYDIDTKDYRDLRAAISLQPPPVAPLEAMVTSPVAVEFKMAKVGMLPSPLGTVNNQTYFDNSIIDYQSVLYRQPGVMKPSLQQLAVLTPQEITQQLAPLQDTEIIQLLGITFPYNSRKELLDKIIKLFREEDFFQVLTNRCTNTREYVTGESFPPGKIPADKVVIGYGIILHYVCYSLLDLQANFSQGNYRQPHNPQLSFDLGKVQRLLSWTITLPVVEKLLRTDPNLQQPNLGQLLIILKQLGDTISNLSNQNMTQELYNTYILGLYNQLATAYISLADQTKIAFNNLPTILDGQKVALTMFRLIQRPPPVNNTIFRWADRYSQTAQYYLRVIFSEDI